MRGDAILAEVRRLLELEVEAGRRYVIDADLATAINELASGTGLTSACAAPASADARAMAAPLVGDEASDASATSRAEGAADAAKAAAPVVSGAEPADDAEQAAASVASGAEPADDAEMAAASAPAPAAATPNARSAGERSAAVGERRLLGAAERAQQLEDLRSRALECTRCPLHRTRTHVVFGVGNPNADLMFVGEAPGRDEDLQGEPFVGRAGQLLTRIIQAIELQRDDVYIANVLKCRPPENRNPNSSEIALCSPFLYEQIELVSPKVLCALGRYACMTLLKSSSPLSRVRGRLHEVSGIPVVVTYHPAALLRYENLKRPTWEDMKAVRRILDGERPDPWLG